MKLTKSDIRQKGGSGVSPSANLLPAAFPFLSARQLCNERNAKNKEVKQITIEWGEQTIESNMFEAVKAD